MAPKMTKGELINFRKLKLYTQHWTPDGEPRAVLIFVHGLGEYSDRYQQAFEKFATSGISVFAYDHVGHGYSDDIPGRGRANVNQFSDLVEDGQKVISHVRENVYANSPPPMFIMGHSVGGLVATHLVLKDPACWESGGLILHSACIDIEWTPLISLQAAFGAVLSAVVPNAALVPSVREEDMSRVPEILVARRADKMLHQGNIKCRIANEILNGFRSLAHDYRQISVPILAIHGTADKCTSMPAVKKLVDQASSTDKTFKPMEGFYHEMLFEPEKDQVIDAVLEWIGERADRRPKARL